MVATLPSFNLTETLGFHDRLCWYRMLKSVKKAMDRPDFTKRLA